VQRIPERQERQNPKRDYIFFLPNFKILHFVSVLLERYLTSGQCYQGNIFPVALPFFSYYASISGWTIIPVQYKTKRPRYTGNPSSFAKTGLWDGGV
jgi:hypothetical protein